MMQSRTRVFAEASEIRFRLCDADRSSSTRMFEAHVGLWAAKMLVRPDDGDLKKKRKKAKLRAHILCLSPIPNADGCIGPLLRLTCMT